MPIMPDSPGGPGSPKDQADRMRSEADRAAQVPRQDDALSQESIDDENGADSFNLTEPTGTGDYVVKEGDCTSSLAVASGHFWETIWQDTGNQELRSARDNPNVLLPGDRVTIPEKETKTDSGATEQRHRFKRKGEPSKLRLKVMDDDEPMANEPYKLEMPGIATLEGTTDAEGKLETSIPGNAKKAFLTVGSDEPGKKRVGYELDLGTVYPIRSVAGIQQRLKNLEYYAGEIDSVYGPLTQKAMADFQEDQGLDVNGQPDQKTLDKLEQVHGC
jgi:N-acetylmuramoyl-L-alanine amidase